MADGFDMLYNWMLMYNFGGLEKFVRAKWESEDSKRTAKVIKQYLVKK